MAATPPRHTRRALRTGLLCLILGAIASLAVALAAAALRPTDGWPNIGGTSATDYREWYFVAQHRLPTSAGDVTVDVSGGLAHTHVSLVPLWVRRLKPEDSWIYTTYPYPQDVSEAVRTALGDPSVYKMPAWVTPCPPSATAHSIQTSAWGWPLRCLRGTVYSVAKYNDAGKFLGVSSTYEQFWIRGAGAAGTRFRQVPLGVIPLGLAVDTIVYAIPIFVLLLIVRSLATIRRRLRLRRNHCLYCNYNLSSLPQATPCPECGRTR